MDELVGGEEDREVMVEGEDEVGVEEGWEDGSEGVEGLVHREKEEDVEIIMEDLRLACHFSSAEVLCRGYQGARVTLSGYMHGDSGQPSRQGKNNQLKDVWTELSHRKGLDRPVVPIDTRTLVRTMMREMTKERRRQSPNEMVNKDDSMSGVTTQHSEMGGILNLSISRSIVNYLNEKSSKAWWYITGILPV
ncbi:hypothetical protein ARMGADRAFT_1022719 [Armillaria gallica]|uniref:Uncharacterized protein n=1 Tax=Armillaria gallica TaxID=47427 RepID=A0A2H3EE14_ARMGA|nr:hypothetical protein ARMGADRAFT_1022719 [Armillaria gallica]